MVKLLLKKTSHPMKEQVILPGVPEMMIVNLV